MVDKTSGALATVKPTFYKDTTVSGDQILDPEAARVTIPLAPTNTPVPTTDINRALTGGTTTQSYIDPAVGTVAGQLDMLLAKKGPLAQRTANIADTRSQALGGSMGGSMASAAMFGALTDRLTPIAQQDANAAVQESMMSKSWDQSLGTMDKQQQQLFTSMDKEFGMTQTLNATNNYWMQQLQQADYDQATKTTLMAGYSSAMDQYIASMTSAGASKEFSQAEADAITDRLNKDLSNYFNIANYDGLTFK